MQTFRVRRETLHAVAKGSRCLSAACDNFVTFTARDINMKGRRRLTRQGPIAARSERLLTLLVPSSQY